jgi:hypothetical protein
MWIATIGRMLRGTLVAFGCVVLAGCSQAVGLVPATSAPPTVAAQVFATEAEALAAASEAFTAYQALSTTIGHEGGVSPERMSAVAIGEALSAEIASLKRLSDRDVRGVGDLRFDSLKLQSANLETGTTTTYVCLDVSQTDVVDATGASTVRPDRPVRYPLQVSFVFDSSVGRLLVGVSESWLGTNFC